MKKNLLLVAAILFVNYFYAQDLNYVQGEVLVQLKKDVTPLQLLIETTDIIINNTKLISRPLNIWKISFDNTEMDEIEVISVLDKNTEVLVSQKNHTGIKNRVIFPDDPLIGDQWQYFQVNDKDIDADEAWEVTTGGLTANGDIIVAAVIDNGLSFNHPDIVDNHWVNVNEIENNGIDDDENGYVDDYNGWNIFTDTDNISSGSHGTPVCGVVGAKGNNGIGVTGVNWDVKVMIIQGSSGVESDVIEAYSYVLEARILYNSTNGEEGSFVVSTNASFGIDFADPEDYPLWCEMYNTLGENGILSCGATINGNYNVDNIGDVPTACPSEYLISVTNTNIDDVKVIQAGYGVETIDLGAPGQNVFNISSGTGYGVRSGTSFATPHVTGTIALLYSAPCTNLADLALTNPALAARRIRDFILEGVDPNESLEGITVTGGRLNVNNSIQALMANCETLAINNIEEYENSIILFPNPTLDGIVTISNLENTELKAVSLYGLDGRLIKKIEDFQSNTINLNYLTSGVYILRFSFENRSTIFNKQIIRK